jgi:organic radical activating enzyme
MHTLDRLKHIIPDEEWDLDARPLMFLDLKLGNICNLKCRICGSWSSSSFASEEIQAVEDPQQRKQTFAYTMLRAGAWPRQSSQFWQDLEQHLEHIRYIEFTGGEPFMIEEHFDLLQGLIDRGVAHQVEIHYNTNGSIWPQRGPDIWQHFRHVEVAFSLDDKAWRFNYQRSGADWDQVLLNIDRFRELRSSSGNMSLQICCTVSVFNILYIGPLWDLFRNMDMDYIYWNMLHDPPHLSIAHAPEAVKAAAREELARWLDTAVGEEFRRVQAFMDQGESWDGQQLIEDILKLDARRGERLIFALPELNRALGMVYPHIVYKKRQQ